MIVLDLELCDSFHDSRINIFKKEQYFYCKFDLLLSGESLTIGQNKFLQIAVHTTAETPFSLVESLYCLVIQFLELF